MSALRLECPGRLQGYPGIVRPGRYASGMNTQKHADAAERGRALPAAVRQQAERICALAGERLTPGRSRAYTLLWSQSRPISAYELLALIEQDEGRKLAPLTIYRQLEFLLRVGLVHKLASVAAYVACTHPEHPHDCLYLVCSRCGQAHEMECTRLLQIVGEAAKANGFKPERPIFEVPGVCRNCRDQG